MDTRSTHILAEYRGCDRALLDDRAAIETLMNAAAKAAEATVVASVFHQFAPQGVSGVVVVEESHLSIHTWPERGYAAVDIYTCGECRPQQAIEVLAEGLGASDVETMRLTRGLTNAIRQIHVDAHEQRVLRHDERAAAGNA